MRLFFLTGFSWNIRLIYLFLSFSRLKNSFIFLRHPPPLNHLTDLFLYFYDIPLHKTEIIFPVVGLLCNFRWWLVLIATDFEGVNNTFFSYSEGNISLLWKITVKFITIVYKQKRFAIVCPTERLQMHSNDCFAFYFRTIKNFLRKVSQVDRMNNE